MSCYESPSPQYLLGLHIEPTISLSLNIIPCLMPPESSFKQPEVLECVKQMQDLTTMTPLWKHFMCWDRFDTGMMLASVLRRWWRQQSRPPIRVVFIVSAYYFPVRLTLYASIAIHAIWCSSSNPVLCYSHKSHINTLPSSCGLWVMCSSHII